MEGFNKKRISSAANSRWISKIRIDQLEGCSSLTIELLCSFKIFSISYTFQKIPMVGMTSGTRTVYV